MADLGKKKNDISIIINFCFKAKYKNTVTNENFLWHKIKIKMGKLKLYTKTGDDGTTGLLSGKRVKKKNYKFKIVTKYFFIFDMSLSSIVFFWKIVSMQYVMICRNKSLFKNPLIIKLS